MGAGIGIGTDVVVLVGRVGGGADDKLSFIFASTAKTLLGLVSVPGDSVAEDLDALDGVVSRAAGVVVKVIGDGIVQVGEGGMGELLEGGGYGGQVTEQGDELVRILGCLYTLLRHCCFVVVCCCVFGGE